MNGDSLRMLALRAVGILGAALFTFFFALTFSTPQWVERFAVEFIEARVSERVASGIDPLRPLPTKDVAARVAEGLYRQNEAALENIQERFKDGVREVWTTALAEVRDLSCECREKWIEFLAAGTVRRLTSLEAVNRRLTQFIQASYMDVATELKRDIRLFTATNACVFLLLLLVSFLKPQAVRHLFVPGVLLCAATLLCAYFYVFEQNWLLTIIYGDYLGLTYAAYLGGVFLFLCDIALNHGRVTTHLVNGLADAVGSSFALVPC
jgi:hypothetical protein